MFLSLVFKEYRVGKFDLDSIFFCSIRSVFSTIALLFFRPSKTLSREENLRPYDF